MAQLINLVVKDGQTRFKLLRIIGRWGPAFRLPLYEAAILSPEDNKTHTSFVAFKIISNLQEDYFNMASEDVKISQFYQHHSVILSFMRHFHAKVKGVTLLCIVLPYHAHVTSLRSLLMSNPSFSGGMDEKMIALLLQRALRGLDAIHQYGKHHTRITADTVFYDLGEPSVCLAYAASLYQRTSPPNLDDSNCLPVNGMLAWGLAPEVTHDESLAFVDVYEADESDIWLIGILALELAYGRIHLENRRELLDIANYISSDSGVLTDTWEELRIKSRWFASGSDPLGLQIVLSVNQTRFSNHLRDFVAMCLQADPKNRASAEHLLNEHGFLWENIGKMKTFSNIVNGPNLYVTRFLDRDVRKKQTTTASKQSCHLSFRHNGITYTILRPIGIWGVGNSQEVYEAVATSGFNDPSPQHVALKKAKNIEGQFFVQAMHSMERSTSVSHINILPLNTHFRKHLKGYETLCMVLPFDDQVLSLRSILRNRPQFANGIPQTCIAVALLHTVRGLHMLHTNNQNHYDITAGNIFYHIEDKCIKVAYAASCYERTYAEVSSELSVNDLLSWGLPPEAGILEQLGLIHEFDYFKGDIWFIGIAALELAYGRIRLCYRRELIRIATYISNVRRLPNTWEELRSATAAAHRLTTQPNTHFLNSPTASENPSRFDECFGNFVALCLDAEPNERPFANELLMHDFLRSVHEGESMEIFEAMIEDVEI